MEIDSIPERPRTPKAWHDAVRNLAGNEMSADKFSSYPETLESGVMYSFLSLTAVDPMSQLPEGIYINTNISKTLESDYVPFLLPIMQKLKDLIKDEIAEPDFKDLTPDINPEFAKTGAKINLATTIGLGIAAVTKSGLLIFAVGPINMSDLNGSTMLPA